MLTKQKMLNELKDIADVLDKTPTKREFIELSLTKNSFMRYWAYYNDFVSEAGLPVNRNKKRAEKKIPVRPISKPVQNKSRVMTLAVSIRPDYSKRYPTKYEAKSIILRWNRQR